MTRFFQALSLACMIGFKFVVASPAHESGGDVDDKPIQELVQDLRGADSGSFREGVPAILVHDAGDSGRHGGGAHDHGPGKGDNGGRGEKNPLMPSLPEKIFIGAKVLSGIAGLPTMPKVHGGHAQLVIGPIQIPADADHHDIRQPKPLLSLAQEGVWVTGFNAQMMDHDEKPLPSKLTHHGFVINSKGGTEGCDRKPDANSPQVFMAAGSELTPVKLPPGYGVYIPKYSVLAMVGEFHNPYPQAFDEAYLSINLETKRAKMGDGMTAVVPMWVSVVDFCSQIDNPSLLTAERVSYTANPGVSEAVGKGKFRISGRAVVMMPHLHDHAKSMKIENLTKKRVMWSFEAPQRANGEMGPLPIYSDPQGAHFDVGDEFALTVVHDIPGYKPYETMGLMLLYIVPDGPNPNILAPSEF